MDWYKIDKYHRPKKGHAIMISENPLESGVAYHVIEVDGSGFRLLSLDKKDSEYIPYDNIEERGDVYAWDRNRLDDFPEYDPNSIEE